MKQRKLPRAETTARRPSSKYRSEILLADFVAFTQRFQDSRGHFNDQCVRKDGEFLDKDLVYAFSVENLKKE